MHAVLPWTRLRRLRISHYNQPDATVGTQSVIILGNKGEYIKGKKIIVAGRSGIGGVQCGCDGLEVDQFKSTGKKSSATNDQKYNHPAHKWRTWLSGFALILQMRVKI